MATEYTLSVYTENTVGILGRLCDIFSRRKINIDSITAMESETPGLYRFTIVVKATKSLIQKIAGQLEKQIDVASVNVFGRDEIDYKEIAMFKIDLSKLEEDLMQTLKASDARILSMDKSFATIEIIGLDNEIDILRKSLPVESVVDFVRSGRIALAKKGQVANLV